MWSLTPCGGRSHRDRTTGAFGERYRCGEVRRRGPSGTPSVGVARCNLDVGPLEVASRPGEDGPREARGTPAPPRSDRTPALIETRGVG